MSLGSILLRPQALDLPLTTDDERGLRALHEFLGRLARDGAVGGPGFTILREELLATFDTVVDEFEPRIGAARQRIDGLLQQLLEQIDFDDPDDALAVGADIIALVERIVAGATPAKIGQILSLLFDAIEDDLGFTEMRARGLLGDLARRLTRRLKAAYAADPSGDQAYNLYAMGGALEEALTLFDFDLNLPPITKDQVVPRIVQAVQDAGLEDRLVPVRNALDRAANGLSGVPGLAPLFGGEELRAGGSAGAAASPTKQCWYATWLTYSWVRSTNAPNCPELEQVNFGEKLDLKTMESIARHSKWISHLPEIALHAASIEKGDIANNVVNMSLRLIQGIVNLASNNDYPVSVNWSVIPAASYLAGFERTRWNDAFGILTQLTDIGETQLFARWSWLLRELLLSILTLAVHDKTKLQEFLATRPPDPPENGSEAEKEAARALVEEFETKLRHYNHNQIDGIGLTLGELGMLLIPLIVSQADKNLYGFPNGSGSKGKLAGLVIGSVLTSIVFSLAGLLIGRAISGSWPSGRRFLSLLSKENIFGRLTFWDSSGVGFGVLRLLLDLFIRTPILLTSYVLDFFIYFYMFCENATDGGRFAGLRPPGSYPGYPDRATSPYRLPWPSGTMYQCVQGNLGIWSHTPFSSGSQIYAYDFSHNRGDIVLAARDGIVWDFRETTPDGEAAPAGITGNRANRIRILHLNHVAGHDFDENGNAAITPPGGPPENITTICEYLHGQQNGVTTVFQNRGIDLRLPNDPAVSGFADVLGWPFAVQLLPGGLDVARDPVTNKPALVQVQAGQAIMQADSTGRSAYNHLHIQVRPNLGSTQPNAAGTFPAVNRANYTIPFVFADSDVQGDDGVPRSLNWYEPDNAEVM